MIQLSYPLTRDAPLYPGTPPVSITRVKDQSKGDSSTTSLISFSSHAGTHLDLPSHVCSDRINSFDFIWDNMRQIKRCICVEISKKGGEPIGSEDFSRIFKPNHDVHALLIRTGMWRIRGWDHQTYCLNHPWIHPDCIPLLREQYPSLKMFGVDLISITNPNFKELGRESHKRLLCGNQPIFILEDLDLSSDKLSSKDLSLSVIPYVQEILDAIPVFCYVE